MKRTLTLGLMIFFVGLLMTACGSDSSSPAPTPATPTETSDGSADNPVTGTVLPQPTDVNQIAGNCTTTCTTYTGRIEIQNAEAFADLVGLNNGLGTSNVFDNTDPFGVIGNAIVGGAATCAQGLFPSLVAWAINGNFELQCGGSTTVNTVNGGVVNNGSNVQPFYDVNLTLFPGGVYTGNIELSDFHTMSDYQFRNLAPVSGDNWLDNTTNPTLGMILHTDGFYYFYISINGQNTVVGKLIQ